MDSLREKKISQIDNIRKHLVEGKTISPLEALSLYRCFRLGARVWDLRQEGLEIENIGTDDGNYAVYRIKRPTMILPPAFKLAPKEIKKN